MIGDLKGEALDSLEGKWGLAVGATLLISILIMIFSFSIEWDFLQFLIGRNENSISINIITFLLLYFNFRWILSCFKYPS